MNDHMHQWRGIPAALSWRDRVPTAAERARYGAHDRSWLVPWRSMRRVGLRLALLVVTALLCTLSGTATVFDTQITGVPEPQTGRFLSLEHSITPFMME